MLKRYFLWTAGSSVLAGFAIPMFIGLCIPSIILLPVPPETILIASKTAAGGMCIVFLAGLISAGIHYLVRRKYIAYYKDYGYRYNIILLKVKDDRVGGVGDRFWGKTGVFPVNLPTVEKGMFSTSVYISRQIGRVNVLMTILLTAHVPDSEEKFVGKIRKSGFNPQELYDYVVKSEHRNVSWWLEDAFKKAVEESPAVKEAFEEPSPEPFALIAELQEAVEQMPFEWHLSNISRIEPVVTLQLTMLPK